MSAGSPRDGRRPALNVRGLDRRVRSSFPTPVVAQALQLRGGSALITQFGSPEFGSKTGVRFTLSDRTTVVVSGLASASRDIVLTIAG